MSFWGFREGKKGGTQTKASRYETAAQKRNQTLQKAFSFGLFVEMFFFSFPLSTHALFQFIYTIAPTRARFRRSLNRPTAEESMPDAKVVVVQPLNGALVPEDAVGDVRVGRPFVLHPVPVLFVRVCGVASGRVTDPTNGRTDGPKRVRHKPPSHNESPIPYIRSFATRT